MTNQHLEALHHRFHDLLLHEQRSLERERDHVYRKWYAGRIDGIRLCLQAMQGYEMTLKAELPHPATAAEGVKADE